MVIETIAKLSEILKRQAVRVDPILKHPVITNEKWGQLLDEIGQPLPDTLKQIYLEEAGGLLFKWISPPETFGKECSYGYFHLLSPDEMIETYREMSLMVNEGKHNNELDSNEGLQALVRDWESWIPLCQFSNGDAFCMDITKHNAIVFLEHDVMDGGPYIHGTPIANNFDDLLERWSRIGFAEYDDWSQCVNENGINVEAAAFRKIIETLT